VDDNLSVILSEKIWASNLQRDDVVKRVANALRDEMVSGRLPPGAKLTPEGRLAIELGVSRPSLREAIRILAHEGRIVVKHGVGTFVSKEPRLLGPLETMRSMTELIKAAGGVPSHRDLSIELVEPPGQAAAELGLADGDRVGLVSRVRLMDDVPFAEAKEYVLVGAPPRSFETLTRFAAGSLYQFLREEFGIAISHSHAKLTAVAADSRVARVLGLRKGAPLLLMRELHYSSEGKPVLLTINHHNSNVMEVTSMRSGART
jgi:GntR family transcriptional regulator